MSICQPVAVLFVTHCTDLHISVFTGDFDANREQRAIAIEQICKIGSV